MQTAEEGIEILNESVDTLIVIPNQRLMEVVDKKMTFLDAFRLADNVLGQGVKGISDLITIPGLINVDFADVRAIMQDSGSALMGIGEASGENRAATAARMAISSPLLEVSVDGAKGILYTITGGPDMTMTEVSDASTIIADSADADSNIIFGAMIDEEMGNKIKISVIATGFDDRLGYGMGTQRSMFGAYSRASLDKSREEDDATEDEDDKIDRAPQGFTQPKTKEEVTAINKSDDSKKDEKSAKKTVTNPFVQSAAFDDEEEKDAKKKKDDESDGDDDGESDFDDEFEIPAFLRQR